MNDRNIRIALQYHSGVGCTQYLTVFQTANDRKYNALNNTIMYIVTNLSTDYSEKTTPCTLF